MTDVHFYDPLVGHGLPHDPFKAIVAPRVIGWISTRAANGRFNLAPYSFFNAVAEARAQLVGGTSSTVETTAGALDLVQRLDGSTTLRGLLRGASPSLRRASRTSSVRTFRVGVTGVASRTAPAPVTGVTSRTVCAPAFAPVAPSPELAATGAPSRTGPGAAFAGGAASAPAPGVGEVPVSCARSASDPGLASRTSSLAVTGVGSRTPVAGRARRRVPGRAAPFRGATHRLAWC